jgi:hypothetical protein
MFSSRTYTKSEFPLVFFPTRQSIKLMPRKFGTLPPNTRVLRGIVGLSFLAL